MIKTAMADNLKITLLAREHISEVARLEKECFIDPWSEKSLEMLIGDSGFGIVALVEDKVVGYGGIMIALDEGQITDIAVSCGYRRRGIGMEIVKAMIAEAASREISTLFLEVRESNRAARELYLACGFEECGVRKNFYRRPTEAAVLMNYKTL